MEVQSPNPVNPGAEFCFQTPSSDFPIDLCFKVNSNGTAFKLNLILSGITYIDLSKLDTECDFIDDVDGQGHVAVFIETDQSEDVSNEISNIMIPTQS